MFAVLNSISGLIGGLYINKRRAMECWGGIIVLQLRGRKGTSGSQLGAGAENVGGDFFPLVLSVLVYQTRERAPE